LLNRQAKNRNTNHQPALYLFEARQKVRRAVKPERKDMKLRSLAQVGIITITLASVITVSFAVDEDCPTSSEGSKHGNFGTRLWERGELVDAERETREAIRVDKDCSMWHQNLAVILAAAGRADEARDSWLKSLQINKLWCTGRRIESLYGLGNYYYKRRDFKKSVEFFEKTMAEPQFTEASDAAKKAIYLEASYNYTEPRENGNPFYNLARAEELKKKALRLNPEDQFVKASITKLLVLQGKLDQAKNNLSELIAEQSKSQKPNPGVYSYLGHIYSLLNDPKNSALFMSKAMDTDPSQGKYLLSEIDKDFKQVAKSKEMQPVIRRARKSYGQ